MTSGDNTTVDGIYPNRQQTEEDISSTGETKADHTAIAQTTDQPGPRSAIQDASGPTIKEGNPNFRGHYQESKEPATGSTSYYPSPGGVDSTTGEGDSHYTGLNRRRPLVQSDYAGTERRRTSKT